MTRSEFFSVTASLHGRFPRAHLVWRWLPALVHVPDFRWWLWALLSPVTLPCPCFLCELLLSEDQWWAGGTCTPSPWTSPLWIQIWTRSSPPTSLAGCFWGKTSSSAPQSCSQSPPSNATCFSRAFRLGRGVTGGRPERRSWYMEGRGPGNCILWMPTHCECYWPAIA